MNPELIKRINAREVWTFQDCLGLGAEFNVKPRFVITLVLAQGKQYYEILPDKSTKSDKG